MEPSELIKCLCTHSCGVNNRLGHFTTVSKEKNLVVDLESVSCSTAPPLSTYSSVGNDVRWKYCVHFRRASGHGNTVGGGDRTGKSQVYHETSDDEDFIDYSNPFVLLPKLLLSRNFLLSDQHFHRTFCWRSGK